MKDKKDQYFIGVLPKLNFRFLLADCSNAIAEIVENQTVKYSSADILAKTVMGSFFVAGLVKEDTVVSIQLEGEGKVERVLTYSSRDGKFRGMVKNKEIIAEMDDKTMGIGKGIFRVNRWVGSTLVSQSLTELEEISFEENLLNYLYHSEQVSSYFSIYLNHKNSKPVIGGFIIQALPDTTEGAKEVITNSLPSLDLDQIFCGNLSDSISIFESKFGDEMKVLEQGIPQFFCNCSLDKIKNAVRAIGPEEANSVLQEVGKVELSCEFCNTKYSLDTEEVMALF